jgi:hypothetical protein
MNTPPHNQGQLGSHRPLGGARSHERPRLLTVEPLTPFSTLLQSSTYSSPVTPSEAEQAAADIMTALACNRARGRSSECRPSELCPPERRPPEHRSPECRSPECCGLREVLAAGSARAEIMMATRQNYSTSSAKAVDTTRHRDLSLQRGGVRLAHEKELPQHLQTN